MKIKVIDCRGFHAAVVGAMLSFGRTDFSTLETVAANPENPEYNDDVAGRIDSVAQRLAPAGAGHDKFLEQIIYWVAIDAPLKFWKQFDTYRLASKSSESTMHTLHKREVLREDFEHPDYIYQETLDRLNANIREMNNDLCPVGRKTILNDIICDNLPDGFNQTRMVCLSAKTLRNMYFQRRNHKIKEWRDFCDYIEMYFPHADLIVAVKKDVDKSV